MVFLFIFAVSCGKREHSNPLDPASGEDTPTPTPTETALGDTNTFTDTFTVTPTPPNTFTHTFTFSNTPVDSFTFTETYTPTNSFTETYTLTHTVTQTPTTVPWLDRGEVANDLPVPPTSTQYLNESPGDPYFYAGMTAADVGNPGEWLFSCVGGSANIENYTVDKVNGTGSLRLFGNLGSANTWDWGLYRCYITITQKLVTITKADGVEFWVKSPGGNIDVAVSLETNLGILSTNPGFGYPHVGATTGWVQHQLAFDTDFMGYSPTLSKGRWVRFGMVNTPAPKGAFSVLLDDIRFY